MNCLHGMYYMKCINSIITLWNIIYLMIPLKKMSSDILYFLWISLQLFGCYTYIHLVFDWDLGSLLSGWKNHLSQKFLDLSIFV